MERADRERIEAETRADLERHEVELRNIEERRTERMATLVQINEANRVAIRALRPKQAPPSVHGDL